MYDSRTAPKFLGKVTTAARSFDTESSGRRRESDIFQGGVETRAGRIDLPEELQPFEWAPQGRERPDPRARERHPHQVLCRRQLHMAHPRFDRDGISSTSRPSIPCISLRRAARRCTCKGVVAGKILVYSPQTDRDRRRSHICARSARHTRLARLPGLVCDRYIEVAPPGVTGPGDLEIHAAIFAGRRFVVTRNRTSAHRRRCGSTGVLRPEACRRREPRYATKIEYDSRFERRRPPGFPSTNRYEVDDWDGQWTETPERSADDAF